MLRDGESLPWAFLSSWIERNAGVLYYVYILGKITLHERKIKVEHTTRYSNVYSQHSRPAFLLRTSHLTSLIWWPSDSYASYVVRNMHDLYCVWFLALFTFSTIRYWLFSSYLRLQGVVHSILCSRLLLRLKGAYESLSDRTLRSIRQTSVSMSVFVGASVSTEGDVDER